MCAGAGCSHCHSRDTRRIRIFVLAAWLLHLGLICSTSAALPVAAYDTCACLKDESSHGAHQLRTEFQLQPGLEPLPAGSGRSGRLTALKRTQPWQGCVAVCEHSSSAGRLNRTSPHPTRRQGNPFVGCPEAKAGLSGGNGSLPANASADSDLDNVQTQQASEGGSGAGTAASAGPGVCPALSVPSCGTTCADERASCETESGCVWMEGQYAGGTCAGACADLSASSCGVSCEDEATSCINMSFGCSWKDGAFTGGALSGEKGLRNPF